MRKVFSAVELKVDAAAEGLKVDVLFRNCRLFPQPARSPVRVYVGTHANPPAPLTDISVELLEPDRDRALSGGATDREGLAELSMDPDAIYPLGGRFRLVDRSETWETPPLMLDGVEGIYPGDFYAINPGGTGDVQRKPRRRKA
jgi:hypothetical protein